MFRRGASGVFGGFKRCGGGVSENRWAVQQIIQEKPKHENYIDA
jgi:hypothetical protein